MKGSALKALLSATLLGITVFSVGGKLSAAADPAVTSADKSFQDAVGKSDAASLDKLLDTYFTWTDVNGRTEHKSDILKSVPKPAIADEKGAQVKSYQYGDLAVVEANGAKIHTLRIWVKRSTGWQTLVYQEVKSLDVPAPAISASQDCENPCKSFPFEAKTVAQKEVITAYQSLETAAASKNPVAWGIVAADEFIEASSNSDKLLDKNTRVTELAHANLSGVAPTPVHWAEMLGFPGGMVVRSMHQPESGMPLQVTNLWIKRNNKWVAALTYETAVHGSSAANTPQ